MTYKLSSDGKAAVSLHHEYLTMDTCPVNTKVLMLGAGGIAIIGNWNGKDPFWKGWFPLPRSPKSMIDQKLKVDA